MEGWECACTWRPDGYYVAASGERGILSIYDRTNDARADRRIDGIYTTPICSPCSSHKKTYGNPRPAALEKMLQNRP